MPNILAANPQISVLLYKSISRGTVDGQTAVSQRYKGKSEYIDLTPFLQPGSAVRTTKGVREPSGAWSITFADAPQKDQVIAPYAPAGSALESVYGLVEPMDVVEIRMWGGTGARRNVDKIPIIMRGFVSSVARSQSMTEAGVPQRQVMISGQDYGKIWQMYQVLYLPAYAGSHSLLTNYALNELFGIAVINAMPAAEFVRTMIKKIINPYLDEFMPPNSPMPRELKLEDGIAVKHGQVSQSTQEMQGSIYEIMRLHGDVGVWNELYTEDREDGVHVVYRPIPALHVTKPKGASDRRIQDDAPKPIVVPISNEIVQSYECNRSDSNVANFFWVNNSRFDLIDEMQRKLASIPSDSGSVSLAEYPNSAVKYYALRPMYAATQQADDSIQTVTSGQDQANQDSRSAKQVSWMDRRREIMRDMNRDNVVLEDGIMRVKGGVMRPEGSSGKIEAMRAGDYVKLRFGSMAHIAYVVSISHEFMVGEGYFSTIAFERGAGFVSRMEMGGGVQSPWLAEQASQGLTVFDRSGL